MNFQKIRGLILGDLQPFLKKFQNTADGVDEKFCCFTSQNVFFFNLLEEQETKSIFLEFINSLKAIMAP